jgi:hypothetical protein
MRTVTDVAHELRAGDLYKRNGRVRNGGIDDLAYKIGELAGTASRFRLA